MLLSLFLVSFVGLVLTTLLLLVAGHRLRVAFVPLGLLLSAAVALASGEIAAALWRLPVGYVRAGQVLSFAPSALVILLRRRWNPLGQAFYGSLVASAPGIPRVRGRGDVRERARGRREGRLGPADGARDGGARALRLFRVREPRRDHAGPVGTADRRAGSRLPADGVAPDRRLQRAARHADRNDPLGRGDRLSGLRGRRDGQQHEGPRRSGGPSRSTAATGHA